MGQRLDRIAAWTQERARAIRKWQPNSPYEKLLALLIWGALGASAAWWAGVFLAVWHESDYWPKDSDDVRNYGLIIGALVAAWLAYWRLRVADRQTDIAHEGQITERFTRAINQLGKAGPENLAIRLGGIYALERIAWDSERDHWQIMEVLTAFVRENRKLTEPSKPAPPPEEEPEGRGESKPAPARVPPTLPEDIQAALTVIGRRREEWRTNEKERLDLSGTDLSRARLANAYLDGAHLNASDLEGADLYSAHLEGAWLRGAHLKDTDLMKACLDGANLIESDLEGAILIAASMKAVGLRGSNLEGAALDESDLSTAGGLSAEMLQSANSWIGAILPTQLAHLAVSITPAEADDV